MILPAVRVLTLLLLLFQSYQTSSEGLEDNASIISSLLKILDNINLDSSKPTYKYYKSTQMDPSSLHSNLLSSLSTILDTHPTLPLTTPPTLISHGFNSDYTLLKKVAPPTTGTSRSGVVPSSSFPLPSLPPSSSAQYYVSLGFTLVLNRSHRRSLPLHQLISSLSPHLNHTFSITSNLYLTPPLSTGFEPHFDYMDVIVLHLSPTPKTWYVSASPLQLHPTSKTKYPPSSSEIEVTAFEVVVLREGDVLYIPAGHVHHATTEGRREGENKGGGGGDSLHVTLGLELTDAGDDRVGGLLGEEFDAECVGEVGLRAREGEGVRMPRWKSRFSDYLNAREVVGRYCEGLDGGQGGLGEGEWGEVMRRMDGVRWREREERIREGRVECGVRVGNYNEGDMGEL